jgi:CarD family transcriptional regulator
VSYKVGDHVVYPNNGLAHVEAVVDCMIGGQPCPCYQLRILSSQTVVVVPVQNAEVVGLRRTIPRRQVAVVLERLRDERAPTANTWKGRFRENADRMRSGQLLEVADVLRDLTVLATSRTLSFREKLMLDKARDLVVHEIAAAAQLAPNRAAEMVAQALGH